MSEAFVKDGTDLAIAEMILGGTTCFNDMYFFPEITAWQAIHHGIRAKVGLIVIDFPSVWAQTAMNILKKAWPCMSNCVFQTCVLPLLPHMHLTQYLMSPCKKSERWLMNWNCRYIYMFTKLYTRSSRHRHKPDKGLCKDYRNWTCHPSLIAVHMTQLTDEEISLFAESGAHIVHCPESNLKLPAAFARLPGVWKRVSMWH